MLNRQKVSNNEIEWVTEHTLYPLGLCCVWT